MYKLVSLDLDGTLLNSHSKVSSKNLEAVAKCIKNDIEVVIATGRPPRFTFGLIPSQLIKNYCVCYNGALIYCCGKRVYEQTICPTIYNDLLLEFGNGEKIIIESDHRVFCNFKIQDPWEEMVYEAFDQLTDETPVYKILIINPIKGLYDRLKERYGKKLYYVETDYGNYIELMDKSVSKLNAIKWIAEIEKVKLEEIIAFGDDLNDLEIISGVGRGVAMSNGHHLVKAFADFVTKSNDEDGVAVVLEKLIEDFYE